MDGATGLENTWKIRRDEDDLDIEDRITSSSREEGNEDKNSCNGKNHKKKKIVNLTTSFSARYLRWVLIDQLNLLNVRFSLMLLA